MTPDTPASLILAIDRGRVADTGRDIGRLVEDSDQRLNHGFDYTFARTFERNPRRLHGGLVHGHRGEKPLPTYPVQRPWSRNPRIHRQSFSATKTRLGQETQSKSPGDAYHVLQFKSKGRIGKVRRRASQSYRRKHS